MALCLGVLVLVSLFASPVLAGASAEVTFQSNLTKIDPAVFGQGPVASPIGSSTPGSVAPVPASVPAGLTVAVVKLKDFASPDWQAQGHDYVVRSLQDVAARTQDAIVQIVEANGGIVLNRLWLTNSMLVAADEATFRLIAQKPAVERIHPNYEITLPPEDPTPSMAQNGSYEWNIARIRAPDAWDLGITGTGVRVCVSDTGFDVNHPDVGPRLFTTSPGDPYYPGGWIEFDSTGNPVSSTPWDSYGHGTHVSGTIAGGSLSGSAIGVAPGVSLMEALIIPGGGGTFEQVIAGVQWCVNPTDRFGNPTGYPANVQSMSWGATGLYPEMLDPIKNSLLAGVIPVAAIGNCGPDCVGTPGAIWGVFAAGATDINDQAAYFSSGGTVNWPSPPSDWPFFGSFPSSYMKPDFAAPGVSIVSTYPGGGYAMMDGTSMATPHLSATVALMIQAYLNLAKSAIDLGPPGMDTRYGYGRIDAYQAVLLSLVRNTGVEGSVFDSVSSAPLPDVRVTAQELGVYVTTNENGTFRMGLPVGSYNVSFERFGYYNYTTQVDVVLLNGTIAGYVVDMNGTPLGGVQIDVVEAGQTLFTNPGGYFETSVQAGTYTVRASAPGLVPVNQSVELAEEQVAFVNFTLYPDLPATLTGTVTNTADGTPLVGALVFAEGPSEFLGVTDGTGAYTISVPTADVGAYRVGAFKGGYWPNSTWIDVTPAVTFVRDFAIAASDPASVAIYQDWEGQLAALFAGAGYTPFDFQAADAVDLEWALSAFPVVYWSGFSDFNVSDYPTNRTFTNILGLADLLGVSILFGDSYDGFPYGINLLSTYLGDPAVRDYDFGDGNVTWTIDTDHPIFNGIGTVGDTFTLMMPQGPDDGDFTWFYGFSGVQLATVHAAAYNVTAPGAAVLDRANGTEWVLLGSLAPQAWTNLTNDWTSAAKQVATNAVAFGMDHSWLTGMGSREVASFHPTASPTTPRGPSFEPMVWVNLTVFLDPMPTGFVAGLVTDTDGAALEGVHVFAEGTPAGAYTDANGLYDLQLPVGGYTIVATIFGYQSSTAVATVNANETTPLDFALVAQRRVGIMGDDAATTIQDTLESTGQFAVRQFSSNWDDLITAVPDLDVVILSAQPMQTPKPSLTQFNNLLAAASAAHVGIMFLDNVYGYNSPWGYSGYYGLSLLADYRGDPSYRTEPMGCSGSTYQEITADHGMTKSFAVGDKPLLSNTTCMPFSYFSGFSGTTVGRIWTGYGSPYSYWGDNLAYKIVGGSRWALMAGYAPIWSYASYWTDAMRTIFIDSALWASTEPLLLSIDPGSGPVGTTIAFTGSLAPASATLAVSFDGVMLSTVAADADGLFSGTATVPEAAFGSHTVSVATLDGVREGDASFGVESSLATDPVQGPPGTVVTVAGHGFSSNAEVELTFPGMVLPVVAWTTLDGSFTAFLAIPSIVGGDYAIEVFDGGNGLTTPAPFRVIVNLALEVQASVGTLHFRGEVVDFYVLVTSGGELATAEVNVVLLDPSGGMTPLDVTEVTPGLYRATTTLPADAATGTYALVAQATVAESYLSGEGAGLATFLVSDTLTTQLAVVMAIQGGVAQVRTDTGTLLLNLDALDAHVTSVDGTLATISTSIGTLQANLATIDAKITAVQGDLVTISTSLGTVQTSLTALDAKIIAIQGDLAEVSTDLGTIQTSLASLDAKITAVQGALVTVSTSIGTLRTNLTALGGQITQVQGNMATVSTSLGNVQASLGDLHATITDVQGNVAHVHSDLGDQTVQISNLQEGGVSVAMYAAVGAAIFSVAAAAFAVLLWVRGRRAKGL